MPSHHPHTHAWMDTHFHTSLMFCHPHSQLLERNSTKELIQVVYPLFQEGGPSSFTQLMSTVSGLFCGYPEGGGSRVLSFNWYEDNNYKVFLGVNSSKSRDSYVYDKTTSEWSWET